MEEATRNLFSLHTCLILARWRQYVWQWSHFLNPWVPEGQDLSYFKNLILAWFSVSFVSKMYCSLAASIGLIYHNRLQHPHQKLLASHEYDPNKNSKSTSISRLWQLWRRKFLGKIKKLQPCMSQQFPRVYPESHWGQDTETLAPSPRESFQDLHKKRKFCWPQN